MERADRDWLAAAIELSIRCPPSASAFSVGAIVVNAAGQVIATGYSRESDAKIHAEEVALSKVAADVDLASATLYSSLEPCLFRASRPVPCAELILARKVGRVVFAWTEPPLFQPGGGACWLAEHGVEVAEMPELADSARAANRSVLAES